MNLDKMKKDARRGSKIAFQVAAYS